MIIGVIGQSGSGKDAFADYLHDNHGFTHVSLSNVLREQARADLGTSSIDRAQLRAFADRLRREHAETYLLDLALHQYSSGDIIFSGVYARAEAEAIRRRNGLVVAIDCPVEMRYRRIMARGSFRDRAFQSFEEFRRQSEGETGGMYEGRIRLDEADMILPNEGMLEDFSRTVDDFVNAKLA